MQGIHYIAAAISMFVAIGAGIGMCMATGKAVEAVARQPEASGKISTVLLLGLALAETSIIFSFVMALMLVGAG